MYVAFVGHLSQAMTVRHINVPILDRSEMYGVWEGIHLTCKCVRA